MAKGKILARVLVPLLFAFGSIGCGSLGYQSLENPYSIPPDGNVDFFLRFGVNGISSYDSVTGTLIKTTDVYQRNPEEYVTEFHFGKEEREEVDSLLLSLDILSYPDTYDPYLGENVGIHSDPSRTIVLTAFGKTVNCPNICLTGEGATEKGKTFLACVEAISEKLTSSKEWQELPPYEFYCL